MVEPERQLLPARRNDDNNHSLISNKSATSQDPSDGETHNATCDYVFEESLTDDHTLGAPTIAIEVEKVTHDARPNELLTSPCGGAARRRNSGCTAVVDTCPLTSTASQPSILCSLSAQRSKDDSTNSNHKSSQQQRVSFHEYALVIRGDSDTVESDELLKRIMAANSLDDPDEHSGNLGSNPFVGSLVMPATNDDGFPAVGLGKAISLDADSETDSTAPGEQYDTPTSTHSSRQRTEITAVPLIANTTPHRMQRASQRSPCSTLFFVSGSSPCHAIPSALSLSL